MSESPQPEVQSPIWRDPWACALGAIAAAVLVLAGAGGPTWLDSGELIAAARELGGIHPPGHPAWLSLSAAVEWLPLGPQAARLAWLSALAGGISVALVVRIARLLLGPAGWTATGSMWSGTAGLALLASGSLWAVGTRSEVYTLALVTGLWSLDAALRAGSSCAADGKPTTATAPALAEVAVAFALGLTNHHYITLFTLPALVVAGWPVLGPLLKSHRRLLAALVAAGAAVGLLYLALPLRAVADTEMRWGNPASLTGFWHTISAAHFQRAVTDAAVAPLDNMLVLFGAVVNGMGMWLAAFGALGLALGWLRRDRAWFALVLAFLGGLATKAPMQIDTHNPDDHGYLLMAAAMVALGIAMFASVLFGPRGLLAAAPERTWARLSVFILPWTVALIALNCFRLWGDPDSNKSGARGADVIDSHIRATLPPGVPLLTNYYGLAFNEQAFRLAEGRRPDLVAAHLSFRTGDTDRGRAYQRWFASRHPAMAPLAVAATHLGRAPVGNILEGRDLHGVYAEADPDKRIPPTIYDFNGVVHRLQRDRETTLDYDLKRMGARRTQIWQDLYVQLNRHGAMDHQTRSLLAWQHALQAAHGLRRGWRQIAADELQRGRKLAPRDGMLGRLQVRLDALDAAWQRGDSAAFRSLWQDYERMTLDQLVETRAP